MTRKLTLTKKRESTRWLRRTKSHLGNASRIEYRPLRCQNRRVFFGLKQYVQASLSRWRQAILPNPAVLGCLAASLLLEESLISVPWAALSNGITELIVDCCPEATALKTLSSNEGRLTLAFFDKVQTALEKREQTVSGAMRGKWTGQSARHGWSETKAKRDRLGRPLLSSCHQAQSACALKWHLGHFSGLQARQ